jgi:hypothetical protein
MLLLVSAAVFWIVLPPLDPWSWPLWKWGCLAFLLATWAYEMVIEPLRRTDRR